jgi:hypothetical protein
MDTKYEKGNLLCDKTRRVCVWGYIREVKIVSLYFIGILYYMSYVNI